MYMYAGCSGSIVVCVSPLISLMMDQKSKLVPRGLTCEFVGEAQDDEEAVKRVLAGRVQLVFISPENLIRNPAFRTMLLHNTYKQNLVALAVDEAHCVATWLVYSISTGWFLVIYTVFVM